MEPASFEIRPSWRASPFRLDLPPLGLPCRVRGASPRPVSGGRSGSSSPSKVLHLSPRAARLYRLDGVRVSLLSSPPAPGLAAGSFPAVVGLPSASFSFTSGYALGSARVGPITSLGIFHPLDTAHVGRTSGGFLVADQGGKGGTESPLYTLRPPDSESNTEVLHRPSSSAIQPEKPGGWEQQLSSRRVRVGDEEGDKDVPAPRSLRRRN